MSSYREVENTLLDILITIKDRLEIINAPQNLIEKTVQSISLINSKRYQVAVIGTFKTGKSSLINALLGREILPADIDPATATINRIQFGKELKATASFLNGEREEIPIQDISKYVTKITPEGAYQASLIDEVVLETPSVICQNHIELIDSPGLNDDDAMTAITLRMIEEVDAIILTISALIPFDDTTCEYVCKLIRKKTITNVVFVVTHIDELDEDECSYDEYMNFLKERIRSKVVKKLENEEAYLEKAHKILDSDTIQIFGISPYLYLQYLTDKNPITLAESRFSSFNDALLQIITAKQIENAFFRAKNSIYEIINSCESLQSDNEKKYDSKIERINHTAKVLDEYYTKNNDSKQFDEFYNANYDRYETCLRLLNKEKNNIAKEFIKTLAGLKRYQTNDEIRQILIQKFEEIEISENKSFTPVLQEAFLEYIQKLLRELIERKETLLTEVKEAVQIDSVEKNGQFKSIFSECERFNLIFSWKYSPITKDIDCIQENLMELIVEAIDQSVECLKDQICDFDAKLRHESLAIIKAESKQERELIQKGIDDQLAIANDEKITFKSNFIEFSSKLSILKERLETIEHTAKEENIL